jgi:hypothetical protein
VRDKYAEKYPVYATDETVNELLRLYTGVEGTTTHADLLGNTPKPIENRPLGSSSFRPGSSLLTLGGTLVFLIHVINRWRTNAAEILGPRKSIVFGHNQPQDVLRSCPARGARLPVGEHVVQHRKRRLGPFAITISPVVRSLRRRVTVGAEVTLPHAQYIKRLEERFP